MTPWWLKNVVRAEADAGEGAGAGEGSGAGAGAGDPPAGETKTPIVGSGEDGGARTPAPADWPDDWRTKAAGGDDAKAKQLARFASPQALADAHFAAQQKIRSGEYKAALPKDAKPEDIAAYRTAHGIPESPEKYDLSGLEIQDSEKTLIGKFAAAAHAAHMTPAQLTQSIKAYQELSEERRSADLVKDQEVAKTAEDALRAEWGNEYRGNISLLTNFLDAAGVDGLRQNLLHGRLADGTPIGSSVQALKFLVGLARKDNPLGILAPSGETLMGSNALTTYQEMRKLVGTSEFRRDPQKQAQYQALVANLAERGLIDPVTGDVKRAA